MTLRLVPKKRSEVTEIKLSRKVKNTESLIYSISKKLKNNPCKIASVTFSNGYHVDVLIINNFKVKNHKGRFVVDTSKKEIDQGKSLHKYKKYFYSSDFEIVSEPILLLNINQKDILSYPISTLLDVEYTKISIKKFVKSEMENYTQLSRNLTNAAK